MKPTVPASYFDVKDERPMGRVTIDDFESILAEVRNVPERSNFSRAAEFETEASDQYQVATGLTGSTDHQDFQGSTGSTRINSEVDAIEKTLDVVDLATLPLKSFVEHIVKRNAADYEARANDSSPEGWRSPAWFIARECKGHPELEGLTGAAAWRKILPLLRKTPDAQPQGLLDEGFSVDFMGSWELVRLLPGMEPIENALRRSAAEPISSGTDRGALYNRLISMAAYLQHSRGDMPIFLPVVKIGDSLGVSHSTVSHLIRWAIEDNFLIVVEAHSFKHHRARSYRFRLERWKKFRKTKGL